MCDHDQQADDMSIDMRLASIIHLLSSSVLRGTTENKTAALQAHLAAAAMDNEGLDPILQDALEYTLANWQDVQCHPNSIPVDTPLVLTAPCSLQ